MRSLTSARPGALVAPGRRSAARRAAPLRATARRAVPAAARSPAAAAAAAGPLIRCGGAVAAHAAKAAAGAASGSRAPAYTQQLPEGFDLGLAVAMAVRGVLGRVHCPGGVLPAYVQQMCSLWALLWRWRRAVAGW